VILPIYWSEDTNIWPIIAYPTAYYHSTVKTNKIAKMNSTCSIRLWVANILIAIIAMHMHHIFCTNNPESA